MSSFGSTRQRDEIRRGEIRKRRAIEIALFQKEHGVKYIPLEWFDAWLTEKAQGELPREVLDAEEAGIVELARSADERMARQEAERKLRRREEFEAKGGYLGLLVLWPIRAVRRLFRFVEERTRPE